MLLDQEFKVTKKLTNKLMLTHVIALCKNNISYKYNKNIYYLCILQAQLPHVFPQFFSNYGFANESGICSIQDSLAHFTSFGRGRQSRTVSLQCFNMAMARPRNDGERNPLYNFLVVHDFLRDIVASIFNGNRRRLTKRPWTIPIIKARTATELFICVGRWF